jgi:single-strand DNA-binding protein
MANCFIGMGRVAKEGELRYTKKGTAVYEFTLAVDSGYGDSKDTCFIETTFWKGQAEAVQQYFPKGSRIYVQGELRTDKWETPEGQKRSKIAMTGFKFDFVDKKQEKKEEPENVDWESKHNDDIPF